MPEPIASIYVADKEVRDRIARLQRKVKDLRPAMKNIGEALLLSTDKRFETETGVDGNPWQPLSQFTLSKKRAEGRILKILQNTGRLRDSINYEARRDSVSVGSNVEYARKPQLGIDQPKREYLGLSKEDNEEIIEILEEFLAEG